jgi:ribose/xylose/arabinose/galactoside ABC-type transport system permease subunit
MTSPIGRIRQGIGERRALLATARPRRVRNVESVSTIVLLGALIMLCVYFTARSNRFLTIGNFKVIAANYSVIAVATVGMALLMISGPVDLSIGSTVGATGTLMALSINHWGWPAWLAIAFAIGLGAALGAGNGLLVAVFGLNPVIVTLGTQLLIRGALELVRDTPIFELGPTFHTIGSGQFLGVPIEALFAIGAFVVAGVFITFTPWGRHIYAIGINRQAAFLSALPVRALPFALYVATGAGAGLAGMLLAARLNGASPGDQGLTFELQALTAILLGGVAWAGGRGRLTGVFLALVFLGVLDNGLTLLNVSPFVQQVFRGLALIVAAGLDTMSGRLTGRLRFRAKVAAQRPDVGGGNDGKMGLPPVAGAVTSSAATRQQ